MSLRKIRFEKYEKKRKELIEIVKKAREKLIEDLEHKSCLLMSKTSRSTFGAQYQSAPDLRGSSQISNEKSKFLLEGVVSDSNRENYEKIVQRAKEREIMLMDKMLKNEEVKNKRYEERDIQRAIIERKIKETEKKKKRDLLKRQEEKQKEEMAKKEILAEEEKKQRDADQERKEREMAKQAIEEEKELKKKKERENDRILKEQIIKEKSLKAAQMKQEEMLQQEVKLNIVKQKLQEREKMIKLKREEQKRMAKIRKAQFEQIKEKVQMNIAFEEKKKLEDYLARKKKKEEQETKIREKKQQEIELLKQKAEERNIKIQQAIEEAQNLTETWKSKIYRSQREAEARLEQQRIIKRREEEKRKELVIVKNEIKKMNAERKIRKDQYKIEKIKTDLEFDDMRREAFATQKDEFKSLRVKNQFQAQRQREIIRTALHHMSVWKVWDIGMVKSLVANPDKRPDHTIEDIIRRKSAAYLSQKRNNTVMEAGHYSNLMDKKMGNSNISNQKLGFSEDNETGTTHYIKANQDKSGNLTKQGIEEKKGEKIPEDGKYNEDFEQ